MLEEDGDSGHGPSKNNLVQDWKKEHKLQSYFNCASLPDLAPIENCWQTSKEYLRKYPHWNDSATKELILEGWAKVNQKFIDKCILSMPKRLQAVIDAEGKMTGY